METLDAPAIVALLLILAVLGSSAVLWIARILRPPCQIIPEVGVPAWSIGWINFGIFVCAMIVSVVVVQNLGAVFFFSLIRSSAGKLTPWLAVLAVLLLQLPMLGVFYGARRFFPGHYAGRLNNCSISLPKALKLAGPLFLRYLPIIWIVTFIWSSLLNILQQSGLIDEVPPQELITLFESGGNPIAIGLLVIFAIVLAPIVEEFVFRGCVYRFLKSQTAPIYAQIISGSIFSMMHANVLSFMPLVVVGILLARVYEKEGHILVSICFHAFFNAFSLLIIFIMSSSSMNPV